MSRARLHTKRARRADLDDRRAARREELVEAAVRAISREGPEASMEDIAAEAGITKPIVYRHFGDKNGLYQALVDRYADALGAELERTLTADLPPRALLVSTLDAYLGFLERETHIHRFLVQRLRTERTDVGGALMGFRERMAEQISRLLRDRLKPAGKDTGAADPWAYALVGMAELVGEWWLQNPTMPRAHVVDYLVDLAWNGLAAATGEGDQAEPTEQSLGLEEVS